MIFHTHYKDFNMMKSKLLLTPSSSQIFFLVFSIFTVLSPVVLADEIKSHVNLLTQDDSPLANSKRPSTSDLSSPILFIKHLEHRDQIEDSTENIRHQRQIIFKSSYSELPEVLKHAEEKHNKGRSLSSEASVKVIPDDMVSRDSAALKDLPPSSEVYFKPQMENSVNNALTKHFGKVLSSRENKIRKRTKKISSSNENFVFRKRGRLVKKKMVGRKLIRQTIPNPKRVDTDSMNFEASSSENFENKISNSVRRGSRRFLFPTRKTNNNNISQSGNIGGPNPVDSFMNPHFIETSSSEVSSYSFVPEESFVNSQAKEKSHKSSSVTPNPQRVLQQDVSREKSIARIKPISHTTNNHFIPSSAVTKTSKRVKLKQIRKPISTKINDTHDNKSTLSNWSHFLNSKNKAQISTNIRPKHLNHVTKNKTPKFIKQQRENKPSLKRGKSFSSSSYQTTKQHRYSENQLPHNKRKSFNRSILSQSKEKKVRLKTGFPDLLNIPETSFDCGDYNSGEYLADEETKCQVFHVCFGGRQASFICPVGTAFSQNLLVCDWWHKVKCGR